MIIIRGMSNGSGRGWQMLEPLRVVELAQFSVERPERKVSVLAGDLQNQAIGETQRRSSSILLQCARYDVRVLNRQARVLEQHIHSRCDRLVT